MSLHKAMQKVLEEIRSVKGIMGVLIWDKSTPDPQHLLPASFTINTIKSTCSKLTKLAQSLGPSAKVKLFYDNGIAIVLNQPRALILILCRADLDFQLFNLVLSSALFRLDNLLDTKRMQKQDFPPLEQKRVDFLIEATNLLSSYLSGKIGTYKTTQNLRQVKEKLIKEFPFMANLFVDNNARVSIIKGKEGIWSGEVLLAFAKWMTFLEKLSFTKQWKIDLRRITSSLEKNLEEMGFYFALQNLRENI